MAKRKKKSIITGVTREQMEQAFGEYATASAKMAKINANLAAEIVRLREKVAAQILEQVEIMSKQAATIEAYAMEHRADLFAKIKSMKTIHGVLGFRTGMPKLKTRKGFTWAAVLELLKVKAPGYIKTTEDIAKDRIIADRETAVFAALMPSLGVEVVQDETFYIEPKTEETEPAKK